LCFVGYLLVVTFVCLFLLSKLVMKNSIYRFRGLLLIVGIIIPIVYYLNELVTGGPMPYFESTIIAYSITSFIYAYTFIPMKESEITFVSKENILDQMEELVIIIDSKNSIIDINESGKKIFNFPRNYKRMNILKVLPELEGATDYKNKEITLRNKTDSVFEVNLTPIKGINDEITAKILVFRDITERKNVQNQLERNIIHFAHIIDQIRNPMSIIYSHIDLEVQDQKQKQKLLNQANRIEEVLNLLEKGWLDTDETRKFIEKYF